MTSKELVLQTLEFRNTGSRVPRDLWTLPWAAYYEKDKLQHIRSSFAWDFAVPETVYSEVSAVQCGDPYECGNYTDMWGCEFTNIHRGIHGEVKTPIVTDDDWNDTSRIVFPEELLSFDIAQVNEACAKSDKWLMADCTPRPFEQLQFIRGTENLYMDLLDKPKKFLEFLEKMHDFYCRLLTKWAQTDVDCLWFMDDWGAQYNLLISPVLWREIFMPMYKDYIEIAHSHGKKAFMHSDGYTLDIIPDLIDIGLDALNTQIFCMGTDKLAQFKGKITFWGEICRQNLLPFGTTEDIFRAVQDVYDTLWDNGGCIAQCEFGAGAKPENVYAVYEAWEKTTSNAKG